MSAPPRLRGAAGAVLVACVLGAGLTGSSPTAAGPALPSGCVVDPGDMLGWWRGEDDRVAEVGGDLTGSTGFTDAVAGRGFALGPDDELALSTLPAVSDGVSVEAWVRPEPSPMFSQALFSRWTFAGGVDDDAFALVASTDGLVLYVDGPGLREPDTLSVATPAPFDGDFHHVAATWGSGQMALYLDGAPVATRPVAGGTINPAPATPFRLGQTSDPGHLRYRGTIDEPTVYDRALTPAEVAAIHATGADGKCTPTPPNTQVGKLFDAPGAADDWFGRSIGMAGTRAILGVPEDDPGGTARVLSRSGSTWSAEQTLVGSDTAANDRFGFSVAIDGSTAVVGAFEDDASPFTNRGSAYVFVRDGTGAWTQQAKLQPSASSNVQNFGRSVAISGDTVVVGSLNDDNPGALDSGAVYVFTRSGTTWTEQARLVASDPSAGDGLGYDVAVEGDTVLAGADRGDDDGRSQPDSGAAYVFTRSGVTWTEAAKLTASDSETSDAFGFSVALDGGTALVGAHSAAASTAGAAYVLTGSGTAWSEQARLVAPDGAFGDRFGFDVALDGNLVVVGARADDDPLAGVDAGSAHVFQRIGVTWTHAAELLADDAAAGDELGSAVGLRAGHALVGAYRDDDPGLLDRGSVYVFGT